MQYRTCAALSQCEIAAVAERMLPPTARNSIRSQPRTLARNPLFCSTSCGGRPVWGPVSRTPKPSLSPDGDHLFSLTKQRFREPGVTNRTAGCRGYPTDYRHPRTPRVSAETENLNSIKALGGLARHLHYVLRGAGTHRRHIKGKPVERRGRKTTGLTARRAYDSGVAGAVASPRENGQ
jgi:hypothetical protein